MMIKSDVNKWRRIFGILLLGLSAAAAWGMWFSPGFSAMFFFGFAVGEAAGEVLRMISEGSVTPGLRRYAAEGIGWLVRLFGIGLAAAAGYIYAVGDDRINASIRGAAILGLLCQAVLWIFLWSRVVRKREGGGMESHSGKSFSAFLLTLVSLAVGWFLLLSGITCPALLPCGLGVMVMTAAEVFDVGMGASSGRRIMRPGLVAVGVALMDLFLLVPAFFAG